MSAYPSSFLTVTFTLSQRKKHCRGDEWPVDKPNTILDVEGRVLYHLDWHFSLPNVFRSHHVFTGEHTGKRGVYSIKGWVSWSCGWRDVMDVRVTDSLLQMHWRFGAVALDLCKTSRATKWEKSNGETAEMKHEFNCKKKMVCREVIFAGEEGRHVSDKRRYTVCRGLQRIQHQWLWKALHWHQKKKFMKLVNYQGYSTAQKLCP